VPPCLQPGFCKLGLKPFDLGWQHCSLGATAAQPGFERLNRPVCAL
jgi:hypothetical protein